MARGWYWKPVVLTLLFANYVLTQNSDTGEDIEEDIDRDYSEPGVPTENCICVPFYQCENGEIVSDGTNLIDPRQKTQNEEIPIEEKYEPPACGPYHVCCREPGVSTVKPYEHRCGIRNPNGINSRILHANEDGESEFGEWPWQAAILRREGKEFAFKCGGTLIDDLHVITVAHCADDFLGNEDNLVVRLGEWDTQNSNEFLQHEDFNVSEIIIHPEYKSNNLHNDIAILKLATVVQFKPHIDTACLPRDEDDFANRDCTVTGWGTNAYKSGKYSVIMKKVTMPVIDNAKCQDLLRKTRLGRYFRLHKGFLCAGGEAGKDSCKGDGGGPLVCYRDDNSYTVAGLVSWGIDCGHEDVPGVYVNVQKYIDWIATKTGKPVTDYWRSPGQ